MWGGWTPEADEKLYNFQSAQMAKRILFPFAIFLLMEGICGPEEYYEEYYKESIDMLESADIPMCRLHWITGSVWDKINSLHLVEWQTFAGVRLLGPKVFHFEITGSELLEKSYIIALGLLSLYLATQEPMGLIIDYEEWAQTWQEVWNEEYKDEKTYLDFALDLLGFTGEIGRRAYLPPQERGKFVNSLGKLLRDRLYTSKYATYRNGLLRYLGELTPKQWATVAMTALLLETILKAASKHEELIDMRSSASYALMLFTILAYSDVVKDLITTSAVYKEMPNSFHKVVDNFSSDAMISAFNQVWQERTRIEMGVSTLLGLLLQGVITLIVLAVEVESWTAMVGVIATMELANRISDLVASLVGVGARELYMFALYYGVVSTLLTISYIARNTRSWQFYDGTLLSAMALSAATELLMKKIKPRDWVSFYSGKGSCLCNKIQRELKRFFSIIPPDEIPSHKYNPIFCPALHIIVLIDASASMAHNHKLARAKGAVYKLLENLIDYKTPALVSIGVFRLLSIDPFGAPPSRVVSWYDCILRRNEEKEIIKTQVYAFLHEKHAAGMTPITTAIVEALTHSFEISPWPYYIDVNNLNNLHCNAPRTVLIVLTDGLPTVGYKSYSPDDIIAPDELLEDAIIRTTLNSCVFAPMSDNTTLLLANLLYEWCSLSTILVYSGVGDLDSRARVYLRKLANSWEGTYEESIENYVRAMWDEILRTDQSSTMLSEQCQ